MFEKFIKNDKFSMINSGGWVVNVNSSLQVVFINTTIDSKFALAPRGYGRSSFRFFEIFQLGTIPVYIWNDVNWLPFQDTIDYSRLCVSIHISKIGFYQYYNRFQVRTRTQRLWTKLISIL